MFDSVLLGNGFVHGGGVGSARVVFQLGDAQLLKARVLGLFKDKEIWLFEQGFDLVQRLLQKLQVFNHH